jgi:hypothetical protein
MCLVLKGTSKMVLCVVVVMIDVWSVQTHLQTARAAQKMVHTNHTWMVVLVLMVVAAPPAPTLITLPMYVKIVTAVAKNVLI